MAMYRIKKILRDTSETIEDSLAIAEYWQELPFDMVYDNFEEFAELNELADEDYEDGQSQKVLGKSWVKAIFALFIISGLLFWGTLYVVSDSIDFSILSNSAKLAQDESLADLRESVVVIEGNGGNGSGFNIREDGLIVTNRHVVEDSGIITIRFGGDEAQVFTTKDWVAIEDVDLAIIDIDGSDLPYVNLDHVYPKADEEIIIIGNPLGYDWTISEGTVLGMVNIDGMSIIHLEGPIHPGSSGSPVFNENSEVIGVIFASPVNQENQGLAIPIEYLNN